MPELTVISTRDHGDTRFYTLSDGTNVRRGPSGKYSCLNPRCIKRRETVDCRHAEATAVHEFPHAVEKC